MQQYHIQENIRHRVARMEIVIGTATKMVNLYAFVQNSVW